MREYLPEKKIKEYQQLMKKVYDRDIDYSTASQEAHKFMEIFMLTLKK